jgi:hypothetical protein
MTAGQEIVEHRRYKRFQVPKSAFVGFGPYDAKVGQIIDVSMGGLAFRYVGTEEPSNGELNIFLGERDFYIDRIPFKTISDFEIGNQRSSSSVALRRSGVKFEKLTQQQTSQLEYFIRNLTLGEV